MAEYAILAADQGTDTTFEIEVVDKNKNPRDLTGFTVAAKFRKQFNSNVVYSFDTSIPSPTSQGKIRITLGGSLSNTIPAGRYFYDVEITNDALDVTERITEGFLEISPGVTRSATDYIATTRLIPLRLDELIDVDAASPTDKHILSYNADSGNFIFSNFAEISNLDSASIGELVYEFADSEYVRSVFSAGQGIQISDSGEISVTTDFIIDSEEILLVVETGDFTLNGGFF